MASSGGTGIKKHVLVVPHITGQDRNVDIVTINDPIKGEDLEVVDGPKSASDESMQLDKERAYQRKMLQHIKQTLEETNKLNLIPDPKQRIVTEENNNRYYPIVGGNQHNNNPKARYDFDEKESKMSPEGKQVDQYYSFQPSKDMNISRSYDANDTQELPLRLNLNIHDNQTSPTGNPNQRTYVDIYREMKKTKPNKKYSEMFSRQKEIERENTPPLITHRSSKHYAPTNDLPLIPPFSVYDTRQVIGPVLPNNTGTFHTTDIWQNQSKENFENVSEMAYPGDQIYQPSAYTQFKDSRRQQPRLPPVSTDQNDWNLQKDSQKFSIDINLNLSSPRDHALKTGPSYSQFKPSPHRVSYHLDPTVALNSTVPRRWYGNQREHDWPGKSDADQFQKTWPQSSRSIDMEMNFPTSREHYKKGKRGIYRVFDINDYKKLKKEMQLRNIALSDPDVETVEEKKEKMEIKQQYGRLVREKNRQDIINMKRPQPSKNGKFVC